MIPALLDDRVPFLFDHSYRYFSSRKWLAILVHGYQRHLHESPGPYIVTAPFYADEIGLSIHRQLLVTMHGTARLVENGRHDTSFQHTAVSRILRDAEARMGAAFLVRYTVRN